MDSCHAPRATTLCSLVHGCSAYVSAEPRGLWKHVNHAPVHGLEVRLLLRNRSDPDICDLDLSEFNQLSEEIHELLQLLNHAKMDDTKAEEPPNGIDDEELQNVVVASPKLRSAVLARHLLSPRGGRSICRRPCRTDSSHQGRTTEDGSRHHTHSR